MFSIIIELIFNVFQSDESHNNRKLEISKLRQEIEGLREEEKELVQRLQQLTQTNHELAEQKASLKQEYNRLYSQIEQKASEIRRLEQSKTERLQRFGSKYPELIRRIDDAHRRGIFTKKPLGPIGNHIQLKDYSCALALELCLKRNIYAFCCDNMNDQKKLKDIIDKLFGNERKPPIITRPFGPRHDVTQYRVESDEYKSFLDLMHIKEAPIANCLIDQSRVEQILYIPDYKRAEELLINPRTAPHNCYQAYTQDGSLMTPSNSNQDYKCYANNSNKRNANILMKNVDQMLIAMNDEMSQMQDSLRNLEKAVNEKNKDLNSKVQELTALENRKKQIRSETITKDTKLKQLEAIGDSPPVEVSTLEEELETHGQKRTELEEKLRIVREEKEALNQLYTEADNTLMERKTE